MATKPLTITEDAYDRLKEHKRDDESFTETILRLTGENRDDTSTHGREPRRYFDSRERTETY